MTMKKKIVIVALVVCIFAMSIASATLAYFTDTEGATNTFTIGNVDIKLSAIGADGNVAEVNDEDANSNPLSIANENVYPTQVIAKDATITNIANDAAYVAAIIEIKNINNILTTETPLDKFLTGGAFGADGYITKVVVSPNSDLTTIYIISNAAIAKNGTVVLFQNINIFGEWDNDDMDDFKDCNINIKAYATQAVGFANAETAITTAFEADFEGYNA